MSLPRLAREGRLAFGGDYNPEQWPESVWAEDVRLMQEAGVSIVTVGVFSWALEEPERGRYDLDWLQRVLDLLHEGGIAVDLATPSASPPAWFAAAHPEALPVTADGVRLGIGAREHACPSSPAYRQAAQGIATQLARRFGQHPALALWHIGNEFGAHIGQCWCPVSEAAFRDWLRRRYGSLDALNAAWGTTFWGQHYGDWEHVTAPRTAPMPVNPAQQLDFRRFSSHEWLACYRGERDAVRAAAPVGPDGRPTPVTTNFMTTGCRDVDYWQWTDDVDVVTNDHYLTAEAPRNHLGLALAADITRGLAGGQPWLLLEHSTSAVNWQERNVAKAPGQMRRNSLAHVARGSDGAMFFQWRASRQGAEKFHSALVPHAGTDSALWRDVVALGADVAALAEVAGSVVRSDVALVWSWESWWALELEFRPSTAVRYLDRVEATYQALFDAHVTTDVVPPDADLSGYRVVVVPNLYLVPDAAGAALRRFVEGGGHLLVPFFSGIVDSCDAVPDGPYPGRLRDLLGLDVEELHPLAAGTSVALAGGVVDGLGADVWSERVRPRGAQVLGRFADGPDAGEPVLTRHPVGDGAAWYLATRLDADGLGRVIGAVLDAAGVAGVEAPRDVEVVRRVGEDASWLFVLNHSDSGAVIAATGTDLLTGADAAGEVTVPAGGVAVVREAAR
jgi:beta-galactosidase